LLQHSKKLTYSSFFPQNTVTTALEIVKIRGAKGEMTKEQFNEMEKEID
jgi:uncharacterized membrane protein